MASRVALKKSLSHPLLSVPFLSILSFQATSFSPVSSQRCPYTDLHVCNHTLTNPLHLFQSTNLITSNIYSAPCTDSVPGVLTGILLRKYARPFPTFPVLCQDFLPPTPPPYIFSCPSHYIAHPLFPNCSMLSCLQAFPECSLTHEADSFFKIELRYHLLFRNVLEPGSFFGIPKAFLHTSLTKVRKLCSNFADLAAPAQL